MTVRINIKSSFKRGEVDEFIFYHMKSIMEDLAQSIVRFTPPSYKKSAIVDTGAYITSHSIRGSSSSGGRLRTAGGKPRRQNPEEKAAEALSLLYDDMDKFTTFDSVRRFKLVNRSPHAEEVEEKYAVYERVGARFR